MENWDPCPSEKQACLSQDSQQCKDTGVEGSGSRGLHSQSCPAQEVSSGLGTETWALTLHLPHGVEQLCYRMNSWTMSSFSHTLLQQLEQTLATEVTLLLGQ